MRFKEYLINERTTILNEELITGGLLKMFKHLEYWFDGGKRSYDEKIKKLQLALEGAGGPMKFAMVVRRLPAVKHFLHKHHGELPEDLEDLVHRMQLDLD